MSTRTPAKTGTAKKTTVKLDIMLGELEKTVPSGQGKAWPTCSRMYCEL